MTKALIHSMTTHTGYVPNPFRWVIRLADEIVIFHGSAYETGDVSQRVYMSDADKCLEN
jgi:hypothetical protein